MGWDLSELRLIKRIVNVKNLSRVCMYCGEPADNKEHVIPKSLSGENTPKVWSCLECNVLAGSNVFESIDEKTDYIHEKLAKRYAKYIEMPHWSDDEILQLKRNLRIGVQRAERIRQWILSRLAWRGNPRALIVKKILEKIDIGNNSAQEVVVPNTIRNYEMTQLVCFENKDQELSWNPRR